MALPTDADTPVIDCNDPRLYDDPWDAYRWLRRHDPVHRDEANELWVVSRHAEVSLVSRNAERYSAAQGVRPRLAAPLSIIAMDDPEHTRQRRLVSTGFTPRKVRELGEHIRDAQPADHRRDRRPGRDRLRPRLRRPRPADRDRGDARPRPRDP